MTSITFGNYDIDNRPADREEIFDVSFHGFERNVPDEDRVLVVLFLCLGGKNIRIRHAVVQEVLRLLIPFSVYEESIRS